MEMSLNSGTTLSMNNMKIYENLNILYHKILQQFEGFYQRNKYVILDILNMLMLKIHRCVTRYILLLITVQ